MTAAGLGAVVAESARTRLVAARRMSKTRTITLNSMTAAAADVNRNLRYKPAENLEPRRPARWRQRAQPRSFRRFFPAKTGWFVPRRRATFAGGAADRPAVRR